MAADKDKQLVVLTVKVPPAVNARVEALAQGTLTKSQVARVALTLGLELIGKDKTLLLGLPGDPKPRRKRG